MVAAKTNQYGAIFGRPTRYEKKYNDMLIHHMEEGLSYESFAAILSVCRDTLYHWEKIHPEFGEARKIGKEKLLLFFEKTGRAGMLGKIPNFNASTFIFTAKNKIHWRDSVDQVITSTNTNTNINLESKTTEDLIDRASKLINKLSKN